MGSRFTPAQPEATDAPAKSDWEDDATAVVSRDDLVAQLAEMKKGAEAPAAGHGFHSEKTKVAAPQPLPDSEPTLAVASPVFDADTVRPPPSADEDDEAVAVAAANAQLSALSAGKAGGAELPAPAPAAGVLPAPDAAAPDVSGVTPQPAPEVTVGPEAPANPTPNISLPAAEPQPLPQVHVRPPELRPKPSNAGRNAFFAVFLVVFAGAAAYAAYLASQNLAG